MSMTKARLAIGLVLLIAVVLAGCSSNGGTPPQANFRAFPTGGYAPSEVQFTDMSLGDINEREWDFDGDGVVDSTGRNPRHTYNEPGTYAVTLTVRGPGGTNAMTKDDYIHLTPVACSANFIASTTRTESGLVVEFTDQSTGHVTGWEWDFDGDGLVDGTEQSPTHVYEAYGSYAVSLAVTGPDCDGDVETKADFINYVAPPIASFLADPRFGTVPITVQFIDQSMGEIDDWAWDFNDDGVVDSTVRNPEKTYTQPGTHTVRLTVTGPGGSDTETRDAYLDFSPAPTGNPTPTPTATPTPTPIQIGCTADFIAAPRECEGPTWVTFTDKSTGEITKWTWRFGANSDWSMQQNPTYKYTKNGVFDVTLIIEGPNCDDRITKENYIVVSGCPT